MERDEWQPDAVFGIDFGMTGTGVAYSKAPEWGDPRIIQQWPDNLGGSRRLDKVPSRLQYALNTDKVQDWGNSCDWTKNNVRIIEYFKLWLDPEFEPAMPNRPTRIDALHWFRDFLKCIYTYLKEFIRDKFGHSSSWKIEFLFSVPTTWKNPAMIAEMKKTIHAAGFGQDRGHRVDISLTEAEAAAIYASGHDFKVDDVFLICDSGGGTTDVNILKIKGITARGPKLVSLSHVEGASIGSARVDSQVRRILRGRLEQIQQHLTRDAESCSYEMMRERFEGYKFSFGSERSDFPEIPFPISHLKEDSRNLQIPGANVWGSNISITREELRRAFDSQLSKMVELIDGEVAKLNRLNSSETISWLVLTGGFSMSPYVQSHLRNRYEYGSDLVNAHDMKLRFPDDPQLAVVRGLILDRRQRMRGSGALKEVIARQSYGVLIREHFDEKKHMLEPMSYDRRDGLTWIDQRIEWLIRKGDVVSLEKGLDSRYAMKIPLGHEKKQWRAQIVQSQKDPMDLPNNFANGTSGAKLCCTIMANRVPARLKRRNHKWYHSGDEHFYAEFDLKIRVGTADLNFEILDSDGMRLNDVDTVLKVSWAL